MKAIDTVEELAASGMEWGSTHDAWIFSILLATQVFYNAWTLKINNSY